MNLPNALTLLRIFFVPLLVAALVQEGWKLHFREWDFSNDLVALCIFLVAALTDLLDGYLARRWNQVTTVGMLLDPIADKLLISAALVGLVEVHRLPSWMAVIIIGREFAVSGLRSIAAEVGSVIAASDLGKAKMVFQVIAVGLLMASQDVPQLTARGDVCRVGRGGLCPDLRRRLFPPLLGTARREDQGAAPHRSAGNGTPARRPEGRRDAPAHRRLTGAVRVTASSRARD